MRFKLLPSLTAWLPLAALAGPVVVPTAEGQLGEAPGSGDTVIGASLEPLPGSGDVLFGGLFVFGGAMPPPPAFAFLTDQLPEPSTPVSISSLPGTFNTVDQLGPRGASSPGDDFVAFSFAVDGSMPETLSVRIVTFDDTGSSMAAITIPDVPTLPFPDAGTADTSVAVDDQGRLTVVYTDFPFSQSVPPRIRARRFDGSTGQPIGGEIPVTSGAQAYPDIALLDPAGDRLIVPNAEFGTASVISGNIIDTTGPIAMVEPAFPISTTAGLQNLNPAVAADPATGAFTVAWENVTAVQGDPVNVRARRFDAQGNPVGDDFVVNTTTASDQGQPDVDYGPNGESVIVWAGFDGDLDVFAQVYDASGQPIGGETKVNSVDAGEQSKPTVRFLPGADEQGRVQFVVTWRDRVSDVDPTPNGTGVGYRCFSIADDPQAIFTDGFESGDTTSWSCTKP